MQWKVDFEKMDNDKVRSKPYLSFVLNAGVPFLAARKSCKYLKKKGVLVSGEGTSVRHKKFVYSVDDISITVMAKNF